MGVDQNGSLFISTFFKIKKSVILIRLLVTILLTCLFQDMKYSFFGEENIAEQSAEGESGAFNQSVMFDPQRLSIFSPKPELKISSLFSQKQQMNKSSTQLNSSPFSQGSLNINNTLSYMFIG